MKSRLLGAVCSCLAVVTFNASAAVITFTFSASGSGELGGIGFTNADFVITAIGDTTNRTIVNSSPDVITYSITHDSASITIDGVGTTSFLTSTRTFYNSSQSPLTHNSGVGFGFAPPIGVDLIGKHNNEFVIPPWDMLSSIGPLSFTSQLTAQWTTKTVTTDLGVLVFNLENDVPTTFQASVVPVPPALYLFGSGLLGLLGIARRKKAA